MGLFINTNTASLIAANNLNTNQTNLQMSLQQLSSGLKINSAADDPAGLVISEQMRAQITGLNQAASNSQNAVSMTQTAEGALDEVNTLLDKARQLTLDASNTGVNDANQSAADQAELDNVISSITRISQVTQFGTKNILDGSLDGATALSASITRVAVGNLANNPAIADGTMTMNVTAGSKGNIALVGTGAVSSNFIFSGTVTGVTMGTHSVNAGVAVTLGINSNVVSYLTTGTMSAATLASKLNALSTNQGYGVTANANGQLVVTKNTIGSSGFTSKLSFTRAGANNITGINFKITNTISFTTGSTNPTTAAAAFSGVAKLSGVSANSVLASGTKLSLYVQASGTSTGKTLSHTVAAGGEKLSAVLAGFNTTLKTTTGFSGGATLAFASDKASGFAISLTQGATNPHPFTFSLNIDPNNNQTEKSTIAFVGLSGATFSNGAGTSTWAVATVSGAALNPATASINTNVLISGNAIEVVISGHTIVVTGNKATATLTALAASIQSKITALGGVFSDIKVHAVTSGSSLTGASSGYIGQTAGAHATGLGFAFTNSTLGNDMTVSLKVDQKSGFDVNPTTLKKITGSSSPGSLDLHNVVGSTVSAFATMSVAGTTISSNTGATVTKGTNASAVLTSANGVTLGLVSTNVTSTGGATMTLDSGTVAKGYNGAAIEIKSTLAINGGLANFTLNQGAVFQVGANGGQTVGLTIQSTSSVELGRNASSTLTSLDDLSSSNESALTTGQTQDALKVIDAAINQVTNLRGQLGAFQADTLQSGLNSLQVSTQNLTSAEGTIRDVDFAAASAAFTKNQILLQSSTAMLAQANQLPQSVLKLLA